jgi:hypothetical protein
MSVVSFYQLVVVEEEDGGRKTVCCWLQGPSTDTPTNALPSIEKSATIHLSQAYLRGLKAPKERCENLEQGQRIYSKTYFSNGVTTF